MQVGELGFAIKKPDGSYVIQGFSTKAAKPYDSLKAVQRRMAGVKEWHSRPEALVWRLPPIPDGKIVVVQLVEIQELVQNKE